MENTPLLLVRQGKAVRLPWQDDQVSLDSGRMQLCFEFLALDQRHKRVLVAMKDEKRRGIFTHMIRLVLSSSASARFSLTVPPSRSGR